MKTKKKSNQLREKGRPQMVTDHQLKQIAMEVKNKVKGQKLTYLLLEKHTGIGRHTWKRRMSEVIEELNKPVLREMGHLDTEDIYFPNIEEVFDKHKNNKAKIMSELFYFQNMFETLYSELKKYKLQQEKWKMVKETLKKQSDEIIKLRSQLAHYEGLYKSLVVSSAFSHLREKQGIEENLIEFKRDIAKNASLEAVNLKSLFPTIHEHKEHKPLSEEELSNIFPDLFSDEEQSYK